MKTLNDILTEAKTKKPLNLEKEWKDFMKYPSYKAIVAKSFPDLKDWYFKIRPDLYEEGYEDNDVMNYFVTMYMRDDLINLVLKMVEEDPDKLENLKQDIRDLVKNPNKYNRKQRFLRRW